MEKYRGKAIKTTTEKNNNNNLMIFQFGWRQQKSNSENDRRPLYQNDMHSKLKVIDNDTNANTPHCRPTYT